MKTEISRHSHQPKKRYSGIYQQQGRMLSDADWNELSDLLKDRFAILLRDLVGTGTPKERSIVQVETAPDGTKTYQLQWGHAVVDGVHAALAAAPDAPGGLPATAAAIYENQADFPAGPPLPATDCLLYLDVWERAVDAKEDSDLMDPGLGGADTCTRTQTMAQLKWCAPTDDPESFPSTGDETVTATLRAASTEADPCDPCANVVPVSGSTGNYLFRIEVHDVLYDATGMPETVTLKWSSENGAESYAVDNQPEDFAADRWVYEFFSDATDGFASEKHLGYHRDTDAGWSPVRYPLESGYPETTPAPMVRRWDGYCTLTRTAGVWRLAEDGGSPLGVDLEVALRTDNAADDLGHVTEGTSVGLNLSTMILTIDLDGRQLLAGDYWLAPVRDAVHEPGDVLLSSATPSGIIHRYMALATLSGGVITGITGDETARLGFPPLTDIRAENVGYDNATCGMASVSTVQDALEQLCRDRDIQWHNKHLHGTGVVCGLKVKCVRDDRSSVEVSPGEALDCDGVRLSLTRDANRQVDVVAAAGDAALLDDDGNGTVALWITQGDTAPVELSVGAHDPGGFWDTVLEGTLIKDFYDDCLFPLVNFLPQWFPKSIEDEPPVSEKQQRLIAFVNLCYFLVNPTSGQYVFLSQTEHDLIKQVYDELKAHLQSETFCAMFDDDTPYPDYTLDDGLDTLFGPPMNFCNRLRLHPELPFAYAFGFDNKMYVFDLEEKCLAQSVTFGGANIDVKDVAFSADGRTLYVVALEDDARTVFTSCSIAADGAVTLGPTTSICSLKVVALATHPDTPYVYGIAKSRGLFVWDPADIPGWTAHDDDGEPIPSVAFNATGKLLISADGRYGFAALGEGSDETDEMSGIRRIPLEGLGRGGEDDGGEAETDAVVFGVHGEDDHNDMVLFDNILYVTGTSDIDPDDRVLVGYDIEAAPDTPVVTPVSLGDVTVTSLAVAAPEGAAPYLLIALTDACKLMRFDLTEQILDESFRVPVQILPSDVEVNADGDTAYVLNTIGNTVTTVDIPAVLYADPVPNHTEEPPTEGNVIGIYRDNAVAAFVDLLGHLGEHLKDCFVDKFLIDCPRCDEDERVYLGTVEIREGRVYNISNFTNRHYVKSFPTYGYWLSAVPLLPILKQGFREFTALTRP